MTFFVLGLAFGAVPALGQGPRPDFSGTWEMDTTRFEKLDPVLAALTLTIQQGPDTLGVKMDVGDRLGPSEPLKRSTTLTRYLLNGEPLQNRMGNGTMASSTLSWDHETLVMRASGPGPDGQQLEITTRWTMEAHGARLVQQQRMQHGQRVANQTLLLSRR
jgi:hypothetical protein